MNIDLFKKNILPENPGVYLFRKGKEILYIGKATSLRDRVKSYFSNDLISTRGPLIVDMVFLADKIDYIETDSVLEALILEADLIKKHQSRYNTKEKDNKSYNHIVITKEDFPRVLIVRERNLEKIQDLGFKIQEKFGPYTNGTQLKEALKIVRKIFPFRDGCKIGQDKPCFDYQLGLCPGTCIGAISKRDYSRNIKNIELFFQGKKKQLIKKLEKDMNSFSKKQEFEKANEIKKTIFALNHIQDVALIKKDDFSELKSKVSNLEMIFRIEAFDIAHINGEANVGVMTVIENGKINKNEYRKFIIRDSEQNDIAGLEEILKRRLKHTEWKFPQIIVVDGGKAQINIARKVLDEAKKGFTFNLQKGETLVNEFPNIEIVSVLKGEGHKPKAILGNKKLTEKYSNDILLANNEAHRFVIKYHRQKRSIY
jgi:excinuclease UvrABC nuclease subunit